MDFYSEPKLATPGSLATGSALEAFGDSLTLGTGATTPATGGYAPLVAAAKGWTLANHGVNGGMCITQQIQIYALSVLPGTISSYLIGPNDERVYGTDPTRFPIYQGALTAQLAWLAIPEAKKVRGQATAAIAYAGTWADDVATYGGTLGRSSTTNGSTATLTLTGRHLFIATRIQDGNAGTFTLTVDGALYGSYSCAAPGLIAGNLNYAPSGIVIPNLSDGVHTVLLTVTSATAAGNVVWLDWAAGSGGVRQVAGPYCYSIGVPRMSAAGYTAFGGSEATVAEYNRFLRGLCGFLGYCGLNVIFVDASPYVEPTADISGDGIHPNDQGHRHLRDAFLEAANLAANGPARTGGTPGLPNVVASPTLVSFWTMAGSVWADRLDVSSTGVVPYVPVRANRAISQSFWGTSGAVLGVAPGTLTDTSSAGTVGTTWGTTSLAAATIAASSATTYSGFAATLNIAGPPVAGANVTLSFPLALYVGSGTSRFEGPLSLGSGVVREKFKLFDSPGSPNAKYGLGILGGEWSMYCPDSAHFSWGTFAAADGTTYVEVARLDNAGRLGLLKSPTAQLDILIGAAARQGIAINSAASPTADIANLVATGFGSFRVDRDGAAVVAQGTVDATRKPPGQTATATWNSAGTAFTQLLSNAVDTASRSDSLLEDWQVGGVSRGSLLKTGSWRGTTFEPTLAKRWTIQGQVGGTTVDARGVAAPTNNQTPTNVQDARGDWLNFQTAAVVSSIAGWTPGGAAFTNTSLQVGPIVQAIVEFPLAADRTNAGQIWVGLVSGAVAIAANLNGLSGVAFLLRSTDTNWQVAVNNGAATAPATVDSGVAAAAATRYTLRIDASDPANVRFWINGVFVSLQTANLPAVATPLGLVVATANGAAATTQRTLRISQATCDQAA